jgi:N-acetyl-anhydromuramyl-L-alanine amidase AmpD
MMPPFWRSAGASYGVSIKETYLQFRSLTNRTVTDMIVMHHIGCTNRDVSAAEVHRWHLANGWAGIGYHYLIRKDGTIERGRPVDTVGAHCYGENYHTVGVNVVGDFETAWPTDAQMKSATRLVAALCRMYRIRPGEDTIVGHRDLLSTACPGQNLYDLMPDFRRDVKGLA